MSTGEAWPAADDAELMRLWASGMPTAAIGVEMGRTKNSIVGRAHRIGLTRPSPVIRDGVVRKRKRVRRAPAGTLPALACVAESALKMLGITLPALPSATPTVVALHDRAVAAVRPAPRPESLPPPPAEPAYVFRNLDGCAWPMWPHGARPGPSPLFCNAARSHPSMPYCAEHLRVAWKPYVAPKPAVMP